MQDAHCRIIRLAGLEKKLKVSGCLPERDEKIAAYAKNVDQEGGKINYTERTQRGGAKLPVTAVRPEEEV